MAAPELAPLVLRPLHEADRPPLQRILQATGAFTAEEVAVALELIDLGLRLGPASGYRFVVAARAGEALGYACFGPAPMTEGVHDLYWIAVDPQAQGGGVGRALMAFVEEAVAGTGGRMLLVETASKPAYTATRAFYERSGYSVFARLPDYYRPGDDKLTYGKRFAPAAGG